MDVNEFLADYDWQETWKYAASDASGVEGYAGPTDALDGENVARVFASEAGANDGASWIAVVEMRDGRWIYVEASCDYTGWG
jgi:hypothetical protein